LTVPLDVVAQITRAVAAEHDPGIDVVVVSSTSGDGLRVEVLVTLTGTELDRSRLLLNLSRHEPAAVERQFRARLKEALGMASSGPQAVE
jgi:hypothetical protein